MLSFYPSLLWQPLVFTISDCFIIFIYILIYFCNFICKNDITFCKFVHSFQFELQFFIGIIVIISFFGDYLINDLLRQMFSFFCFSLRLALVLLWGVQAYLQLSSQITLQRSVIIPFGIVQV